MMSAASRVIAFFMRKRRGGGDCDHCQREDGIGLVWFLPGGLPDDKPETIYLCGNCLAGLRRNGRLPS